MEYRDFYKLAKCLNALTNGYFNDEEIACFSYDYMIEYNQDKKAPLILSLVKEVKAVGDFPPYCKDVAEKFLEEVER